MAQAEATRREYLGREASVKSIGSLYILGGVLSLLGGIARFAMTFDVASAETVGAAIGGGAFFVIIASFQFALGNGLRKLRVWARWTAGILSGLSLVYILKASADILGSSVLGGVLVLLIGGWITGYVFYLLVSPKSSVVTSPQYKQIILQTPHTNYKMSPIFILLGIVLVLFALAVIAFVLTLP